MTKSMLPLPPADTEGRDRPLPDRMIRHGVLTALGQPPALYGVTVRLLWEDHYRVNVLVGNDPTALRIAHSFFVQAGKGGDILSTVPRITRLYA
jgi:hypothetical protein